MTAGFHYVNKEFYAENLALAEIAHRVGTPVYCYSQTQLENNYHALHAAMAAIMPPERFTICYACKASGNIALLRALGRLGAGADIVSGGELARADRAGIAPGKTVFSGVGKTAAEIEQALRKKILQINAESMPEIETISAVAQRLGVTANVAIRVNPGIEVATHAKIATGKAENKFGIDILDVPEAYARAARLPGIALSGLSLHIGSQLLTIEPFRRAFSKLHSLCLVLRSMGHAVTTLDLGGGIGIPYRDEAPLKLEEYAALIAEQIAPLDVHVILEPGRLIAGNAGVLLSRVLYVKESPTRRFVILDAAMNDLLRPSMYEAYHKIMPALMPDPEAALKACDVVGPVCESGDTFLRNESLPHLGAGDLVAIMNSGAYGAAMSSTYNTRPLVPEVLVRGNDFAVIRVPQTVSQILAAEVLPAWPDESGRAA